MTEEQNKLADELDAEVKNERSGKIANLMMRASAALREREPATEAVLRAKTVSEVTTPVLAAPGAFNLSEFVNAADVGGADSPHQVVYKLQRAINAALKGKGASQGAGEFVPVFHAFCPKCGASYEHENIPSEASLRAGSFCPNCKELKYALVGVLHWKLAADEQKG